METHQVKQIKMPTRPEMQYYGRKEKMEINVTQLDCAGFLAVKAARLGPLLLISFSLPSRWDSKFRNL